VAHYDRAIPPGGSGKIRLRVNTVGYSGLVHKSARVYSNDPQMGEATLLIKALIKVPIYISSRYVYLYGTEGQSITRSVEIRAELDKPLTLSATDFNLTGKVAYTLEEIEKGRKFLLQFKTIPGGAENYQGLLKLSTNYDEKPELIIRVRGRLVKASQGGTQN